MIRAFLISLLASVVFMSSCSSLAVAAATVNGEKISESQVEDEFDRVRSDPNFGELLPQQREQARGNTRREILTGLIRQAVVAQQALRLKVRVSDAQVTRLIESEAQRQGVSVREFLSSQNLTMEAARVIGQRIVRLFAVCDRVVRDVDLTTKRLREIYDQQKAAFEEVHLLRITVPTQEAATNVLEELSDGSFERIARERSQDPAAAAGGDLGYVRMSTLDPNVAQTLRAARVGRLTDPIATGAGVEIYRLVDRRTPPLSDVADEIRAAISTQERQAGCERWLDGRLRSAKIAVNPKYGRFNANAPCPQGQPGRCPQVVPGSSRLRS